MALKCLAGFSLYLWNMLGLKTVVSHACAEDYPITDVDIQHADFNDSLYTMPTEVLTRVRGREHFLL
eukprot:2435736-Amphidinium_carterae.1